MFTGDHVMGWSTTIVPPPDGDMVAYFASLQRLLDRRDATYYPTHGPPIPHGHEYVTALARRTGREREAQVLEQLAMGPRTILTMVKVMYADVGVELHRPATRSVLSHLFKLVDEGRVHCDTPSPRYGRRTRSPPMPRSRAAEAQGHSAMSLDSVDDVTRSLNELRRMLAANDLSGVRRLVYFGQLDWLRERLEPREYFAMRDRVQCRRHAMAAQPLPFFRHHVDQTCGAARRQRSAAHRQPPRASSVGSNRSSPPTTTASCVSASMPATSTWMQQRLDQWSLETLGRRRPRDAAVDHRLDGERHAPAPAVRRRADSPHPHAARACESHREFDRDAVGLL